jgi:hypothetical protein
MKGLSASFSMKNENENEIKPWNGECELCYGKHPFKQGEWFFHILHPWSPDVPINVCQICWFRSEGAKLVSKHQFA